MKRLTAVIVAAVSALLFAGGSGAANPSGISPLNTVVDYGELVRVSGTPEVCGLSQAPTRVKIQKKTWTKQEMTPVIFCWASKTGKPIVGAQVAMIYWMRGKSVVALTNWQKRGNLFILYPKTIWGIMSLKEVWGTEYNLDIGEVPLSADQLTGKVKKKTQGYMGREIIPREAQQFSCNALPGPQLLCGKKGAWDENEWNLSFLVLAPWRSQDIQVLYQNPTCGCQADVAYDPSGRSGGG